MKSLLPWRYLWVSDVEPLAEVHHSSQLPSAELYDDDDGDSVFEIGHAGILLSYRHPESFFFLISPVRYQNCAAYNRVMGLVSAVES